MSGRVQESPAMTDGEAAVAAALDYFEGWYDADPARVDSAPHPDFLKRWVGDPAGPLGATRTKDWLLELVRQGGGADDRSDDPIEVHVAEGWRIVDAFWQDTEPPS